MPMTYDGFEFSQLSDTEMRAGIENRIKEYEARLFETMMNSKAEAVSSNPQRHRAIAEHNKVMDDLKKCIEMCKFELSMVEQVTADQPETQQEQEAINHD